MTQAKDISVAEFIDAIKYEQKRADSRRLNEIFQEVSGFTPRMWGASTIGYGSYHYKYKSGREGDYLATGFAPRKAKFSVHILPGYADFSEILKDIGKHKMGKSCLYFNKLADIDQDVLARLIRAGLDDLARQWSVSA